MATREEEQVIIQQFLRFGETKSIAQEIILQDTRENRERAALQTPKTESEIKKFIERSSMSMSSFMRGFDARHLIGRSLPSATPPSTLMPPTSTPVTTRIMSPSLVMQGFSPTSVAGRSTSSTSEAPLSSSLQQTPSPLSTGSPLTRLQGMQPFDYRREHLSPTVSPATGSEKSLPLSSSGNKTPEDLSIGVSSASTPPSITPMTLSSQGPKQGPKPDSSDELTYNTSQTSDDSNDGVINYSTKALSSSSVFADRKVKHLRKSANPMKRHWQPNPAFGSTLISPSGKKRVLCTACNKTFCDKGALKIHYSAVHLKEMHKCTVEGCNMMFSSRRSRNRHSANPNPKLHMPNQKRKMPEGATLIDEKLLPLSLQTTIATTPIMSLPPSSLSPCMTTEVKPVVPKTEPGIGHDAPLMSPEMGFYLDPTARLPLMIPSPVKVPKLDLPLSGTTAVVDVPFLQPPQVKREPLSGCGHRSARKRKSAVPTRCAQLEEMYVMSDDDGMAVGDAGSEENLMPQNLTVPKVTDKVEHKAESQETEATVTQDRGKSDKCTSGHCDSNDNKDRVNATELTEDETASKTKNFEGFPLNSFHDIQEKAIRQMDSISQAHLRDVCSDLPPKENDDNNNDEEPEDLEVDEVDSEKELESSPLKHHPNPLGAALTDSEKTPESGASSPASHSQNTSSDLESLDSGGESSPSQTNGHNGKDYLIDLSDIPLDKENPRRCSACGKMFQNHFGVKTHYQNVHLKLMHTCTVEGCNAAFPSKRSRDRHSANLNLHRKLLSTSSSDGEGKTNKGHLTQSLRDEFLPRIYDAYSGSNTYTGPQLHLNNEDGEDCDLVVNMSTRTDANMNNSVSDANASSPQHVYSNGGSPANHDGPEGYGDSEGQDESHTDPDGMVKCHICRQHFRDNLVLKEHYEKVHPKEMYRCTISGCDKIFSTRKSRNRHSQNDNLHRHLSPSKNGTP